MAIAIPVCSDCKPSSSANSKKVCDTPVVAIPLSLTVTRYGGHCGFFDDLRGPTWLERRIFGLLGADDARPLGRQDEATAELRETS